MNDNYDISISRTPDGRLIVTSDQDVPMGRDCIEDHQVDRENAVFIHLDVIYEGKRFPIWYCGSQDLLEAEDLEKMILDERRPQIIEAFKKWEEKQ